MYSSELSETGTCPAAATRAVYFSFGLNALPGISGSRSPSCGRFCQWTIHSCSSSWSWWIVQTASAAGSVPRCSVLRPLWPGRCWTNIVATEPSVFSICGLSVGVLGWAGWKEIPSDWQAERNVSEM
jgi:hypothetical protein